MTTIHQLIAIITLTSCQPAITHDTSQGVKVIDETGGDIKAWQADLMTEYLLEELDKGAFVLKDSTVLLTASIQHPQGGEGKRGYADVKKKTAYVGWDPTTEPCVAKTSFIHELTHIIQYETEGIVDYKHESDFWDKALEAKYRAQVTMCPHTQWDEHMPNKFKLGLKCHKGE